MDNSEIDALDRRIIDELLVDARIPIATLALKVGLSRQAMRHRIDRLESKRVISGYTIRLGRSVDNLVNAVIMVYRKDRMRGAEVIKCISKIPEVLYCAVLSGEIDLIVHLEAKSHERVSEIWTQISSLPGVGDTRTCFVLSPVINCWQS